MMTRDPGKPYHILLAEDDLDDQKIASDAFADAIHNAHLFIVNNGTEAITYLKNSALRPDIFITDIMMPQLTGFEALAIIKTDPDFTELPVVVLSTSREPSDIKKGHELGATLYISKPFKYRDWVAVMKQISALLPE